MSIHIDYDRLSAIPPLEEGGHDDTEAGFCIMEAAAYVAGEPWSDHPQCVCPVIGAFLRAWNDALPDDERDALLRNFIPLVIGTRGDAELERRRATMAADWLIRSHTPAWLRLAGMGAQADALASLPEITDFARGPSLMPALSAARADACAAWDAAWDADWDAAWDAAWAAAWDAARAAAWDAARAAAGPAAGAAWDAVWAAALDAAWDAAKAAAWDAARAAAGAAAGVAAGVAAGAAAGAALKPTRTALQQSALALVHRMIEAKETV